ncbi:13613_t:CDS:2, partial [Cetraspora pellucida]
LDVSLDLSIYIGIKWNGSIHPLIAFNKFVNYQSPHFTQPKTPIAYLCHPLMGTMGAHLIRINLNVDCCLFSQARLFIYS